MGEIIYHFTADGYLTVKNDTESLSDEYRYYFDSVEENRIVVEDDPYSMIYYDEDEDMIFVSDDSDMMTIWFERHFSF